MLSPPSPSESEDRLVRRRTLEGLTDRRPDSALGVLLGVGHLLMPEVPELYAATIGRWWGNQVDAQVGEAVA